MMDCFKGEPGGHRDIEDADQILDSSLNIPARLKWILRPWRFLLLRRALKPAALVFKIPTLGQLPLVRLMTLGYPGRVIVWVEGLCWTMPGWTPFLRLLRGEPLLSLSRMFLNNRRWACLAAGAGWEFVVSSQVQEAEIRAVAPLARTHRIPNSVRFPGAAIPSGLRADGELRIGFLGHSYLIKGARELVLALEILKRKRIPISARFAFSDLGSRGLLGLVQAAGHRLEGSVSLPAFFGEIDLLVCPYWVDWGTNVFPNVLLECLYFGVPVLTTDLPLTREIFQGADSMAVFTPRPDPEALAEALGDLATGRRALPGREGLTALFARNFDPERTAQQWKKLLAAPSPTR